VSLFLVFDFDGTLADSSVDILESVAKTCEEMSFKIPSKEEAQKYIGVGIKPFLRDNSADDKIYQKSLEVFDRIYTKSGQRQTKLYPGMRELIFELKSVDKAILSNKREKYLTQVVDFLDLNKDFLRAYGGDSFEAPKPNPMGLNSLMQEFKLEPKQVLMIGDTDTDLKAAQAANCQSCFVDFGYGKSTVDSDYAVKSVNELSKLLIGLCT